MNPTPEAPTTFRRLTTKLANSFFNSRFVRMCVCMDEDIYRDLTHDAAIRDGVCSELEMYTQATENECLPVAASTVYEDTSIALTCVAEEDEEVYEEFCGYAEFLCTPHTMEDWDEFFAVAVPLGLRAREADIVRKQHLAPKVVQIVPRFISAATLQLRAKLGRMPLNEANRLTVEMEYSRICRNGSVRACMIDAHRQHVLNAYFTQFGPERVATSRQRTPAWVRRALGMETPQAVPAVC